MSEPVISVVVPTYQRARTVGRTLDRLAAQDLDAPFEVIVVDNGSTDATSGLLAERAAADERVRVLRIEVNAGPGPARNAGWRAARAPIVAFTDDDCEPDPVWLRSLLEATDAGADVVMGRTTPAPEEIERAGPFSHWVRMEWATPWFPTCNIAYRRDLLTALDGFDESFTARFGSSFGDDTDLAWRAIERGADVRFQPAAVVHHEVTPSDWRRWVRATRRRGGVPDVIARHPGLRAHLPMPYVYTHAHGRALTATAGLLVALARPRSPLAWAAAAALARPYVGWRMRGGGLRPVPGARRPSSVAGHLVADLVEIAVVGTHAIRARTPVV